MKIKILLSSQMMLFLISFSFSISGQSLTRGSDPSPKIPPVHFPEICGDPAENTWSIYIRNASIGGVSLVAGDEIAIYDGTKCVGSIVLAVTPSPDTQFETELVGWSTFCYSTGYTSGNPVSFKLWQAAQNIETVVVDAFYNNEYGDAWAVPFFPSECCQYSIVDLISANCCTDPPTAFAGTDATVCAGISYLLSAATATNYDYIEWSTSGTGTFNNPSLLNPTYTPSATDLNAAYVNLTIGAFKALASPAFDAMVLTINPLPVVTCPANQFAGLTDPPFVLTGGLPEGGTYSGPGVTEGIVFDPTAAGEGVHTITYTYTNINNCTSSCSFEVTVISGPAPVMLTAEPGLESITLNWQPVANTAKLVHFPDICGDPAENTWSIYVNSATLNGINIVPGDEIAIFDGEKMVGSKIFTVTPSPETVFETELVAWSTFCNGPGYTPGNPITFKIWKAGSNTESIFCSLTMQNPYGDAWDQPVFPSNCCEYSIVDLTCTFSFPYVPQFNIYENTLGLIASNVEGNSYTITGLTGGIQYCFYVIQIMEDNSLSAPSNIICAVPETSCPNPPQVNAGVNAEICAGAFYYIVTASASGYDTILWTTSGTGTFSNPAAFDPVYYPGASDILTGHVTLTLTATKEQCIPVSDAMLLTIYPLPQVTCPPNQNISINAAAFPLTGGFPEGGVYSGNGVVSGNTFDPAVAGLGIHTLNYSYSDNHGCSASCQFTINVTEGPAPVLVSATPGIRSVSLNWTPVGNNVKLSHFPEVIGDPAENTWSIYVNTATLNGFTVEPGDEIAIYDDTLCVGSKVFTVVPSPETVFETELVAFSALFDTPGYTPGNPITIKIWKALSNLESDICNVSFLDPYEEAWTQPVFPSECCEYSIVDLACTVYIPAFNVYENTLGLMASLVTGNSYTVTNLTEGVDYCFYVKQIMEDNSLSNPSNVLCAVPLSPCPVPPTAYAGTNAWICTGESYTLTEATASGYDELIWSTGGTGSFSNTTILHPVYFPGAQDYAAGMVSLTLTAVKQGCQNVSHTMELYFNPLPVVTCPANFAVSVMEPGFILSGGQPEGGVYSGAGVTGGNFFDPAIAGTGSFLITYTYSDGNGCTSTCQFTITVLPGPAPVLNSATPGIQSVALNWTPVQNNSKISHFPEVIGDPAENTWSIYINSAVLNTISVQIGDEIAIYDDTLCVGSKVFEVVPSPQTVFETELVAFSELFDTQGYIAGNPVTFKIWRAALNIESEICNLVMLDPYGDAWAQPVFPTGCCEFSIVDLACTAYIPTFNVYENSLGLIASGISGNDYTVQGLNAGTQYCFYVKQLMPDNSLSGTSNVLCAVPLSPCINPPTANAGVDASVCAGNTYPLSMATASNYELLFWTTSGTGTFSNINILNPVYTPSAADISSGSVILTLTASKTYCNNVSDAMVLSINPLPQVTCPAGFAVCVDASPVTLTGGQPAGGVYSGPGVTNGIFYPSVAGVGVKTITYTYTNSNQCSNFCTFTITVNPLPTVTCPANFAVCIDAGPVTLTGGQPAGGVYSGPGVTNGIFYPSVAGTGVKTITYTYTNSNQCSNFCTFTITVNPLPTVTCPANFAVCVDASPVTLTGGQPAGGVYSGPGVAVGVFYPAVAGTGTHTITYTYMEGNGCDNFCTFTITVNPLPTVTCPANFAVCVDAGPVTLTGGQPAGGVYSGSGVSNGLFYPSIAGVGSHIIAYTYTDANGCDNFCTFTITVNPLPTVICPADFGVCIDAPPFPLTGGLPAGGIYTGQGVTNGVFYPTGAGLGAKTITYIYTDLNGCDNYCTFVITVNPLPTVTCPANFSVCVNANPVTLTGGLPVGGVYTGPGVTSGIFYPSTAGVGYHTITYTYTDGNGCDNFCTFLITVNPLPNPAGPISGDNEVCQGETVVYTTSAIPNSTSYSWTLTPAGAGQITNNGTAINILFSNTYEGAATLTVSGTNGCGNGTVSPVFNIQVMNCTGIAETGLPEQFTIRPNPASNELFIAIRENVNAEMSIRIMDIYGKLILSIPAAQISSEVIVDVSSLKQGIYFVLFSSGTSESNKKLIISR